MNKNAPNGLGELCASKNKSKPAEKGRKFPASETYNEKIVNVYVKSEKRTYTFYYENYTTMYKGCVRLGITNITYYKFWEYIDMMGASKRDKETETFNFEIIDLPVEPIAVLPNLPVGKLSTGEAVST